MSTRATILTLFLFLGFSFTNCNSDDDLGCGNITSLPFFDIQSFQPLVHYLTLEGQPEIIVENSTVNFSDYGGLRLLFDVDFIAQQQKTFYHDFSLINSLAACTPLPQGTEGSKTEKFNTITVNSLIDFDDDHPANSNINDLINIRGRDVDGYFYDAEDLNTFLAKNELIQSMEYVLTLKSPPSASENLDLEVSVELSTGESFRFNAPKIKIAN